MEKYPILYGCQCKIYMSKAELLEIQVLKRQYVGGSERILKERYIGEYEGLCCWPSDVNPKTYPTSPTSPRMRVKRTKGTLSISHIWITGNTGLTKLDRCYPICQRNRHTTQSMKSKKALCSVNSTYPWDISFWQQERKSKGEKGEGRQGKSTF